MKRIIFTLVMLLALIANGQAQDKLKVGEVKNGKLLITNPDALKAFMMNSLEKSGTLKKDFQVSAAPEGDRFFVYYPVSGNKDNVTNIGVMLVKIKDDAFIVGNPPVTTPGGGGSFEVQCMGLQCNACLPNVKWVTSTWLPVVYCECLQPGGGTCNMTSRLIVQVNIY